MTSARSRFMWVYMSPFLRETEWIGYGGIDLPAFGRA